MRLSNIGVFIFFVVTLSLQGCSAVFGDIKDAWRYATSPPDDATLTAGEIEEFSYTALYARRDDQARALIVLGFVDGTGKNAHHQWVSAQREVLETRSGRIVRTYNLEPDLLSVSNLEDDPLSCFQEQLEMHGLDSNLRACESTWNPVIETQDAGHRFTVALRSQFIVNGNEVLTLANGQQESSVKVTERITTQAAPGRIEQTYENYFWLAHDGLVLKSHQHFLPGEPGVGLDIVKWVGRYE